MSNEDASSRQRLQLRHLAKIRLIVLYLPILLGMMIFVGPIIAGVKGSQPGITPTHPVVLLGLAMAFGAFLLAPFWYLANWYYNRRSRALNIPLYLQQRGLALEFEPRRGVDIDPVLSSGVVPREFDQGGSGGLIRGTMRGLEIQSSELGLYEVHHQVDAGSSSIAIFAGIVFKARLGRSLAGRILVLSEPDRIEDPSRIAGLFGPISLGDPDFERSFQIYARPIEEARELLSPNIRRGIKDLIGFYETVPAIAISGDDLIIAINCARAVQRTGHLDSMAAAARATPGFGEVTALTDRVTIQLTNTDQADRYIDALEAMSDLAKRIDNHLASSQT